MSLMIRKMINPVKQTIIAEIEQFLLKNDAICAENVEITNKERQIAFKIGENDYELTLVQKRKPKKAEKNGCRGLYGQDNRWYRNEP